MKNIITISGEPVSGKGTVVKLLKSFYEEKGMKVEVVSVGHEFRRRAIEEYKLMHPEVENPTIEQVNNDPSFAPIRAEIDHKIDSDVAEIGRELSEKSDPNTVYIFDSRLAFSNIPNSFSIRLTVDEKAAGERVFNDQTRGKEDTYETVEQAIESTKNRRDGEIARYKERYGVDLTDEDNYDLVINTSHANPEEITKVIANCFELQKTNQPFAKTWASPKWFLPLQNIWSTGGPGGSNLTLNEFKEMLKKEGYKYDKPIKTIQVDGYYYIIEGHHRNFAAGEIGMSLIPYDLIAKDDEIIPGYRNTARQRIEPFLKEENRQSYLTMVYDHEEFFLKQEVNGEQQTYFYTDIYGTYPQAQKKDKNDREDYER